MAYKYIIFECLFAPKWSGYCVGIFSKYPIVYEELLEFKELSGDGYPKYSAGLADIALPWDTVGLSMSI